MATAPSNTPTNDWMGRFQKFLADLWTPPNQSGSSTTPLAANLQYPERNPTDVQFDKWLLSISEIEWVSIRRQIELESLDDESTMCRMYDIFVEVLGYKELQRVKNVAQSNRDAAGFSNWGTQLTNAAIVGKILRGDLDTKK